VIARTKKGKEILDLALAAGRVSLRSIESWRVKSSQRGPLKFKKQDFDNRLAMIELSGHRVPDFRFERRSEHPFISFVRNLFVLFNVQVSNSQLLQTVLALFPFALFRLYYGVYRLLLSMSH
jgi:hypothetical protein